MPYKIRDTAPPAAPIARITDEEWYPLIDTEIQRVPAEFGIYILCEGTIVVHADRGQLQTEILMARKRFPNATRFSLRFGYEDDTSARQFVELLRREFGLTSKEPIGFR